MTTPTTDNAQLAPVLTLVPAGSPAPVAAKRPPPQVKPKAAAGPRRGRPMASLGEREAWLERAVALLAPLLVAAGAAKLAPQSVRVCAGWPSTRKGGRIGECWSPAAAADHRAQIFVAPVLADGLTVLGVLAHELIHAAVGLKAGHGPAFRAVAVALGLTGKMTATTVGPELAPKLERILRRLGAYPHAQLNPAKSGRKVQSTRMLKCECPACGYTVRTTRTWAEMGLPECPLCEGVRLQCPALDGDVTVTEVPRKRSAAGTNAAAGCAAPKAPKRVNAPAPSCTCGHPADAHGVDAHGRTKARTSECPRCDCRGYSPEPEPEEPTPAELAILVGAAIEGGARFWSDLIDQERGHQLSLGWATHLWAGERRRQTRRLRRQAQERAELDVTRQILDWLTLFGDAGRIVTLGPSEILAYRYKAETWAMAVELVGLAQTRYSAPAREVRPAAWAWVRGCACAVAREAVPA